MTRDTAWWQSSRSRSSKELQLAPIPPPKKDPGRSPLAFLITWGKKATQIQNTKQQMMRHATIMILRHFLSSLSCSGYGIWCLKKGCCSASLALILFEASYCRIHSRRQSSFNGCSGESAPRGMGGKNKVIHITGGCEDEGSGLTVYGSGVGAPPRDRWGGEAHLHELED